MRDTKRNLLKEHELAGHEEPDVRHREQMLDEALEETFPASDPVSLSLTDVRYLDHSRIT